ncbi:acyl-homoserine-lactone synthase [Hyphomicrobium sp. LHD-15]|uniref:acyl-homoserine-lactone synthase n=1 Tax=Hyphomicrobium sp. LHD-15 TaxID=3072142 RepID=UPI00280F9338|nr:acyl-homoserine-lactone synthase [Hyphomicrobium sp. LHD-15]MDQ8700598.1 acyl-homoserine-lactone synthase [Hyphomicrobium sp. LHD-15]
MLHIITGENRHLYQSQVDDSFRIRHRIYVHERGWKDLARADGREVDQFDNSDAIYLLMLDETDGRVIGGSRLIPSLKPHLLADVFPQLASTHPVPRSPNIYEWTRFYVVPERREPHATSDVACTIMCGVQEFGLEHNLSQFSIVTEPYWIPRFLRLGWSPRPLGLPIQWQGMDVVGITVDVSEFALRETRRLRGIRTPVLSHNFNRKLAG